MTNQTIISLSDIVLPLLRWYDNHARILPWRGHSDPYAVWVSEIMLQQTRVEAVKPYFDRWMQAFPSISVLANAAEDEVLKRWEGLGYYSRARNLQKAARQITEQYGGSLPPSYEELRKLPGIGEYTAGAVGSIAFGLPVPSIDGNVLRVVTRLAAEKADIGTAATKKLLSDWIRGIIPVDRPGDFNQALMELGATVCLPNGIPKCGICPIAAFCKARLQGRITEFPVKTAKPARKKEKKTVLILLKRSERTGTSGKVCSVALSKRPENGLLAGLWEFPNQDGSLTEEEIRKILDDAGVKISTLYPLKKARHIFTHIEWEMTGYLAEVESAAEADAGMAALANADTAAADADTVAADAGIDMVAENASDKYAGFQWIHVSTLDQALTLPAAFKTYYQIMKQFLSKES